MCWAGEADLGLWSGDVLCAQLGAESPVVMPDQGELVSDKPTGNTAAKFH